MYNQWLVEHISWEQETQELTTNSNHASQILQCAIVTLHALNNSVIHIAADTSTKSQIHSTEWHNACHHLHLLKTTSSTISPTILNVSHPFQLHAAKTVIAILDQLLTSAVQPIQQKLSTEDLTRKHAHQTLMLAQIINMVNSITP